MIVQDRFQLSGFLTLLALTGAGALLMRASPKWLLGLAVCVRLAWFINEPAFTDDHFRYLHEGQASLTHLAAPYNFPPADLVHQPGHPWAAQVNHAQVTSSYFPLLQLFFALTAVMGALAGHQLLWLQLMLMLFEMGLLFFIWRHSLSNQPTQSSSFAMYAFHPLPLLEVYGNSHSDIIGVFLLVISVFSLQRFQLWRALLLAAAAHVKPFILAFLLFLGDTKRKKLFAWACLFFFGMMLPHYLLGANVMGGFFTYAEHWHAFSVGFDFFDALLRLVHPHASGWIPRLACGAGWLCSLFFIWRSDSDNMSQDTRLFWTMFTFWLFFPTVHPWYLLWLLPFACMDRNTFGWLWCAIWLGHYLVLPNFHAGMGWQEPLWPRLILISGGLGLLTWKLLRRASREKTPTSKDCAS
ncbi:MAG: hypothetical protein CMH56_10430 [Myxococcales bacterium]|nr:hypothetical protein [Myxococcales bacterium]